MKIHKHLKSVRVISVVAVLTSALAYSVFRQQCKTKLVVWCVTYIHTVLRCNGPIWIWSIMLWAYKYSY